MDEIKNINFNEFTITGEYGNGALIEHDLCHKVLFCDELEPEGRLDKIIEWINTHSCKTK